MEINTINNRYQQPLSPTQIQETLKSGVILKGLPSLPPGAQPSHRFVVKTVHPVETRQSSILPINVRNSHGPQGTCMKCQQLQDQISQLNRPCQNCVQLLEQIKYLTNKPDKQDNCNECTKLKEQIKQKDYDLRELALRKEEELQSLQSQFQRIALNSNAYKSAEQKSHSSNNQMESLQQQAQIKQQQYETLQDECTQLRNKLQNLQDLCRSYEQKIEDSKYTQYSNIDRYMIEIESLKDQLKTKVKEIEVLTTKLYIMENTTKNDDLLSAIKSQYEQLQTVYQLELAQNKQLMRKIESQQFDTKYQLRLEALEQELKNKTYDHQNEIRILNDRYKQKLQDLETQQSVKLQQSKRDIDILKSQIQARSSDIDISRNNSNKEINSLRRELDMKESYIHELLLSIDSWKEKYAAASNITENYDQKITQLNKVIQGLQTQVVDVSQYQAEIDSWKNNCYQLDQQYQIDNKLLQTEIQALKRAIQQSNQKIETYQTLQTQYNSIKQAYFELELQIQQKNDQIGKLQSYFEVEITKYKSYIENQHSQLQSLQSQQVELVSLKQQINELHTQNLTLNQQLTIKIQESKQSNKSLVDQFQYQIKEKDDQIQSLKLRITALEKSQIDISIITQKDEEIKLWNTRYQSLEYRYTQLEQQLEENQCEILKVEIKRLQQQIVQLRSTLDQQTLEINDKVFIEKKFKEQEQIIKGYKLSTTQNQVSEYTYQIPVESDQVSIAFSKEISDLNINRQFTFQDGIGQSEIINTQRKVFYNDSNDNKYLVKDTNYNNYDREFSEKSSIRDNISKSHLLTNTDSLDVRKSKAQLDSRAQRWI